MNMLKTNEAANVRAKATINDINALESDGEFNKESDFVAISVEDVNVHSDHGVASCSDP